MRKEKRPRRFFLIGFMGAGKTSVGRDLAKRLKIPFYDLDELIEKRLGKPIGEIFKEDGESVFRTAETRMLEEIAASDPGVVATGGGAFTRPENREIIHSSGVSIWLDAPTELILERGGRGAHRPLWAGAEKAKILLDKRLPHYRMADVRFDVNTWSPEEAAEKLIKVLEIHNHA
jgi:shikimate kinase